MSGRLEAPDLVHGFSHGHHDTRHDSHVCRVKKLQRKIDHNGHPAGALVSPARFVRPGPPSHQNPGVARGRQRVLRLPVRARRCPLSLSFFLCLSHFLFIFSPQCPSQPKLGHARLLPRQADAHAAARRTLLTFSEPNNVVGLRTRRGSFACLASGEASVSRRVLARRICCASGAKLPTLSVCIRRFCHAINRVAGRSSTACVMQASIYNRRFGVIALWDGAETHLASTSPSLVSD